MRIFRLRNSPRSYDLEEYWPLGVHWRHLGPAHYDRVEAADGVEVLHPVKPTHDVDLVVKTRRAVVGSRTW